MAKRTETDCDICHCETTENVFSLAIPVEWETDQGAGGHGHVVTEDFELCPRCSALALAIIMKELEISYEQGQIIVKRLKAKIKKRHQE